MVAVSMMVWVLAKAESNCVDAVTAALPMSSSFFAVTTALADKAAIFSPVLSVSSPSPPTFSPVSSDSSPTPLTDFFVSSSSLMASLPSASIVMITAPSA